MEIFFRINALLAASLLAAKNDIRYYLNGVFYHDGKFIATNGHMIVSLDSGSDVPGKFIIKNSDIAIIKRVTELGYFNAEVPEFVTGLTDRKELIGVMEQIKEAPKIRVRLGSMELIFDELEGKYPDYEKVIGPAITPSDESVCVNSDYINQVSKAAKQFMGSRYRKTPGLIFTHYGKSNKIRVTIPEKSDKEFVAMIMPMRF